MSDNDPTYVKPVHTNPYEQYNPYAGLPDIPPLPPKVKHPIKWRIIVLCMYVVVIGVSSLIVGYALASHAVTSTPITTVTPTHIATVTLTATPIQIPTAKPPQAYTASTIEQ